MTDAEHQARRQHVEQAKVDAVTRRTKVAEGAAVKCAELWNIVANVDDGHAYIECKGIRPAGMERSRNTLLVPLCDAGDELRSLQFIQPDGSKRFRTGGTTVGCYCVLGGKPGLGTLLFVCEGWAMARSLYETTGYPVAAAMSAGSLLAVAQALRVKLPDVLVIVCANDDAEAAGNPGLTKAREVAQAIGALLTVPDFGPGRPDGVTDFNDLHVTCGGDAALAGIEAAETGGRDADVESAQEADITSITQAITSRSRLMPVRAAGIVPRAITWLQFGWLSTEKISLLTGSPDVGKTTLVLAVSAIVPQGDIWPDGAEARATGRTLIQSNEDDPADTLVSRLMMAGADLHRVHFTQAMADEHGEL